MPSDKFLLGGGIFAAIAGLSYWGVKTVADKKDGITKLSVAAQPVSKETGIPLSFIVTQAAHESNYGRSGLATKSNNLFGIKADSRWAGQFDVWPTYEVINGQEIKTTARFRKYNSWTESVRDWVKFLQASRYADAYRAALNDDAKGFFNGLQKAGYATDPHYGDKLVATYQAIEALI